MTVHCSYCQASLPFFRELAEVPGAASSGGRKRAVVAVFPDAAPDVNVFEERENFRGSPSRVRPPALRCQRNPNDHSVVKAGTNPAGLARRAR